MSSKSRTGSPAALSWIQNSKPPVVPMPGIAGGAMGMNTPVSIACGFAWTSLSTALALSRFALSADA